jgi:hypothetical protein
MLDPNHELVKLAQMIDLDSLAAGFGPLYAETGRPGVPIRTMFAPWQDWSSEEWLPWNYQV